MAPFFDAPILELRLLGGLSVQRGDPTSSGAGLPGNNAARLLAYLTLHPGRVLRRTFLAGVLWPDVPEERARRRLTRALWDLQSAIGPRRDELVVVTSSTLTMPAGAPVWVDVREFETALGDFDAAERRGASRDHLELLERAVAIYVGDLLPDHYDEWIEPERAALRERFLGAVRRLVQLLKARGDYDAATVHARRLVAATPLNEAATAELMRLYWHAGRRGAALLAYDDIVRRLDEEVGTGPDDELRSLAARLREQPRRDPPTAAPRRRPVPRLVGRGAEAARLFDLVDAAFTGGGRIGLVQGEAGAGKTALLRQVANVAQWRGAIPVWVQPHAGDAAPYGALVSALEPILVGVRREQVRDRLDRSWTAAVSSLFPGMGPIEESAEAAGPSDPREAILRVLVALSAIAPLVVVIDEATSVDAETVALFADSAARLVQHPVVLLVSYTRSRAVADGWIWDTIVGLEQRHLATRIQLSNLDVPDTAALLVEILGEPAPTEVVERLHQATGGNPALIEATVEGFADVSALAGGDLASADTVAPAIEALGRMLEQASPAVAEVVAVLAAAARPLASEMVVAVSGLGRSSVLAAIAEGIEAGFITDAGTGYRLGFGQLAPASLRLLDEQERRSLYARVGAVSLDDASAHPADVAAALRAGGLSDRAVEHLRSSAESMCEQGAFVAASDLLSLATESMWSGSGVPWALSLVHAEVLDLLGRPEERDVAIARMAQQDPPDAAGAMRLALLRSHVASTEADIEREVRFAAQALGVATAAGLDPDAAATALARSLAAAGFADPALRQLGVSTPQREPRARIAAALALERRSADPIAAPDRSLEARFPMGSGGLLHEALEEFRVRRDPIGEIDASNLLASHYERAGDDLAAAGFARHAAQAAHDRSYRCGEALGRVRLGSVLVRRSPSLGEGITELARARAIFEAVRHTAGLADVLLRQSEVLHLTVGDDVQAEQLATAARRSMADLGDPVGEGRALLVLAGIRRRSRSFSQARKLCAAALALIEARREPRAEIDALRQMAWIEADAGAFDDALAALDHGLERARVARLASNPTSLEVLRIRCLGSLGRVDEARSLLSAVPARLADTGSDVGHLTAWWHFLAANAIGDRNAARSSLELANERLDVVIAQLGEQGASCAAVPENAAIREAFDATFAREAVVMLPRVGDPTGEAILAVCWTVHEPDDLKVQDRVQRRRRRLRRLQDQAAAQGGVAGLDDLAEALGASRSTIKRDLADLRSADDLADLPAVESE